jgi:hypothetical protein
MNAKQTPGIGAGSTVLLEGDHDGSDAKERLLLASNDSDFTG